MLLGRVRRVQPNPSIFKEGFSNPVFSIQSSLFQFKVHHTYNNKFFQATNTLHWTEGAIQPLIRGPYGKTLPHGMTPFVIFCFGSIPKLNHNWPFQTDSKGLFFIFNNLIPFLYINMSIQHTIVLLVNSYQK